MPRSKLPPLTASTCKLGEPIIQRAFIFKTRSWVENVRVLFVLFSLAF